MTFINCSEKCAFQKDGKCEYNSTSEAILTPSINCAYFTKDIEKCKN